MVVWFSSNPVFGFRRSCSMRYRIVRRGVSHQPATTGAGSSRKSELIAGGVDVPSRHSCKRRKVAAESDRSVGSSWSRMRRS